MNSINSTVAESDRLNSWAALLALAAREVFTLMLASDLADAPDSGVPESAAGDALDVTAMVGLAGRLCGVVKLHCKTTSAALMASKMLGVELVAIDAEMWDAVGEVCNMVAGNFKNKIAGMGDGCKLSVPSVVTGTDYKLHAPGDVVPTEIRLLFEGGLLIISLTIHN